MNIDDWFTWPTKSTDPGVNFVAIVVIAMLVILALAVGAVFIIPIVIVIGIAKVIHVHNTRPTSTAALFQATQQRVTAANFPATDVFVSAHLHRVLEQLRDSLPTDSIFDSYGTVAVALYDAEDLSNSLPPLPPMTDGTIEDGRYRDRLLTRVRKIAEPDKTLDVINRTLGNAFVTFVRNLPPIAHVTFEQFGEERHSFATVPLIDVLPNAGVVILELMTAFHPDEIEELGLFTSLRNQLDRNLHDASGVPTSAPANKLVFPTDYKGSPQAIVRAYLRNTPFEALFYCPVPMEFTDARRFEHMHVVGGSGHGKTQFLQHLVFHDLMRDDPPALVIIDSQGEMLRNIQNLELFAPGNPLSERLIIIDPEDVEHPPALNMFDIKPPRLGAYSQTIKEQIEASTIETFNYIFGSLAAELTSRQNTTFAFVTRLLLSIPGATIHTLRDLFEDGATSIETSPFKDRIRALDSTSQAYFENQFFTRAYVQTKQQIARRLYSVLQVPAFDRMFASPTNRLDMFGALQSGSIVLINTSKALLKTDASALFGRYMIARVISAAFERIAIPEGKRKAAFLIVDEAAEYFDDNLETLLTQARKYNVGIVFAHQYLDQLAPSLRAAVSANTSIKLAGGVSDRDARSLAPDMRTTAENIGSMAKHSRSTEFACYVRNYTTNAVRLEIPFGELERAPTMSQETLESLIRRNREQHATVINESVEPKLEVPPVTPEEPAPPRTPGDTTTTVTDDWRS